jgi:hypothetical protein
LVDSTDFASDVFRELVADPGQLDFPSPSALMTHLTTLAEAKVMAEVRRMRRRDGAGS